MPEKGPSKKQQTEKSPAPNSVFPDSVFELFFPDFESELGKYISRTRPIFSSKGTAPEELQKIFQNKKDTFDQRYRKLMQKFHPDLHSDSPEKQEEFTKISQRINEFRMAEQQKPSYDTDMRKVLEKILSSRLEIITTQLKEKMKSLVQDSKNPKKQEILQIPPISFTKRLVGKNIVPKRVQQKPFSFQELNASGIFSDQFAKNVKIIEGFFHKEDLEFIRKEIGIPKNGQVSVEQFNQYLLTLQAACVDKWMNPESSLNKNAPSTEDPKVEKSTFKKQDPSEIQQLLEMQRDADREFIAAWVKKILGKY